MKDEILVKLIVLAGTQRDEMRRMYEEADALYEEVVTLAIQIHGDPSVVPFVKEDKDERGV